MITAAIRIQRLGPRDLETETFPLGLPGDDSTSSEGLPPRSARGIAEYRCLYEVDVGAGKWGTTLPRMMREIPERRQVKTIELTGRSAQRQAAG